VGFLWLLSAASTDVWLISALDRGIELRSAAGAVAPVGVALEVAVGDVTSAFAAAILSAPVCKMNL